MHEPSDGSWRRSNCRTAVNFPAGTDLSVAFGPEAQEAGSDGGSEVLTAPVRIPPGDTVIWTVEYVLGQPLDGLRILPGARWPGIEWRAGGRTWNDEQRPRTTVDLPREPN